MSKNYVAAKNYPDDIFKQTTPDEAQEVGGALVNVLTKSWQARSLIYEVSFADEETNRLRIQGPYQGGAFMSFLSDGGIRIRTGPIKTQAGGSFVAGSATMGLWAEGGLCLNAESGSNLYFNAGRPEDEDEALNILADGDIVTKARGSEYHIRGKTLVIDADDEVIIKGSRIRMEATGKIEMAASQVFEVAVNDKKIITGQIMEFGAGERTEMKFDPRSTTTVLSPGQFSVTTAGDYVFTGGGCASFFAAGGPGSLVKKRNRGMSLDTKTKFVAGGTLAAELVAGKAGRALVKGVTTKVEGTTSVEVKGNTSAKMEATAGLVELKGTKANITGTTEVKVVGAKIYLN